MPEQDVATLEARITRALDARRPLLEELVAAAVDRELLALVEREVDAALERLAEQRTNGATPAAARVVSALADTGLPAPTNERVAPSSSPATPATSTALCADCHERPRAPRRAVCKPCRTRRDRERARRRPAAVNAQGDPSADETRRADPEPAPAGEDHQAHVTAETLAVRIRRRGVTDPLSPAALERWLLRERLAIVHDGRLVATARGHAIGGAIA